MKPAYSDNWTTIYLANALNGLQALPERSVHSCITSPPYWGLRSYLPANHPDKAMELGAEPTPEAYVERLVEVFRALKRVLRDDGTLWLNLGDSYAGSGKGGNPADSKWSGFVGNSAREQAAKTGPPIIPDGLKPKDLVGIPWMVAFALRADGWYLRSEITWCKKAPMPESVTDRPSSATEKLFLFAKNPRYFYDSEAVKEKSVSDHPSGNGYKREHRLSYQDENGARGNDEQWQPGGLRNLRNYWILGPAAYKGAHYATFPPDLIYPCIKAGTSERGVCEACGAPWERVVERTSYRNGERGSPTDDLRALGQPQQAQVGCDTRTVGWQPTCSCNGEYIKEPYEATVVNRETGEPETFTRYRSVYVPGIPVSEHPVVPPTVLDPFMGSGTTALAARTLGRRSIGLDLDERNIKQVEERLGPQGVLL